MIRPRFLNWANSISIIFVGPGISLNRQVFHSHNHQTQTTIFIKMFNNALISALVFSSTVFAAQCAPPGQQAAGFFDSVQKGTQFTTGPCKVDADCQTGCCGQNLKCRNPPAFQNDGEFCGNGLTIDFAARNTGKGNFFILSEKAVSSGFCTASGGAGAAGAGSGAGAGGNAGGAGGNAKDAGAGAPPPAGGAAVVTTTVLQDCAATPLANGGTGSQPAAGGAAQQPAAAAAGGACPAGSSFDVSPKCTDAKTSTTPQGGPQFALFDKRCKGEQNTTSKSDKDELCCTGCSDGLLCRAPDALKGVQTCRDGTAPDFSSGSVKFVKKAVSDAACGGKPKDPKCGVPAEGIA